MLIPVAQYTPDQPAFQAGSSNIINVIPNVGPNGAPSYRPFPAYGAATTTPLTARCQGAFYVRDSGGAARQFAGDATKLYQLVTTTWTDASRLAGGAYATAADDQWDYVQFGSLLVAVNGTDVPQKFTIDSSTNFTALTGSPPTGARFIEVMGDFVVMARFPSARTTVRWGAINDAENWPASATTQADSQVIPDGGDITGLIGYEYGGLVFQERAIRRMDYEGSPVIFRFKKIADGIGATIPGSVAGFGDRAFFNHRSGFFMVVGGAQLVPIGSGLVDRSFWSDMDSFYLTRISSAVDPVNKLYGILYSQVGSAGVLNRMLVYHWDSGWWAYIQPGSLEFIWSATAQLNSYTLDSLDTLSTSIDALPFSLDSVAYTGTPQPLFGAFGTDHNSGGFNGSALAPSVDTVEAQIIDGHKALVRQLRPTVDGGTPSVALGTRNRIQDSVSFGAAVPLNSRGFCRYTTSRARYHRARITLSAGDTWSHIQGIDEVKARAAGGK